MTNPIDKVARAIDVAGTAWLNAPENAGGDDEPGKTWIDVPGRVLAIAALRAIREPTEEMVKVMVAVHDEHEDPTDTGRSAAQRLAFQAAIDKALET